MLQANKFSAKMNILIVLIIGSVIISILCFLPIFNNRSESSIVQSDTLFYVGKDTSENYFRYLLMNYEVLNKDSVYIKRHIVRKNGIFDYYHYFMVQKNDSLILIKPIHDDEQGSDSTYIDLRKGKIAHVYYFLNRLDSELEFVGYEQYKNKKGGSDSLIIMYGCDISESGCFEEYKNYWYFDKNFHLRKAVSENGTVFLIDKHYFGSE